MSERFSVFTGVTLDQIEAANGYRDAGAVGPVDRWPAHITVSPPAEMTARQLDEFIRNLEANLWFVEPFIVTARSKMMVGETFDLEATEVGRRMHVLHTIACGALFLARVAPGQEANLDYSGLNYRPHYTRREGRNVQPGQHIPVHDLSIYGKQQSDSTPKTQRRIIKRIPLGSGD